MQEILIKLRASGGSETERVIERIESAGGRVLHVYPPIALVASIAETAADEIGSLPDVEWTETGAIDEGRINASGEEAGPILRAWNERLLRHSKGDEATGRGLHWDASGFQPPDPPPEVREMLRRREEEGE